MKKKKSHCIRCDTDLRIANIRCLITKAGLVCEDCWRKPERKKARRCE